jgi:hypothetical protein
MLTRPVCASFACSTAATQFALLVYPGTVVIAVVLRLIDAINTNVQVLMSSVPPLVVGGRFEGVPRLRSGLLGSSLH